MTLPQLIFTLGSVWMFAAIGMAVAAYRENKRKLKESKHAHKAEQTTLDSGELESLPEPDDIDWAGLGIQRSESPFVYMHPWSN